MNLKLVQGGHEAVFVGDHEWNVLVVINYLTNSDRGEEQALNRIDRFEKLKIQVVVFVFFAGRAFSFSETRVVLVR